MKKKLFLLVPTVTMLLAGVTACEKKSADEEEEEEIPQFDSKIYGTEESPLTVSQLIANVPSAVAQVEAEFSYYVFHVEAYVVRNTAFNSSYSTWDTFYIKDALTPQDATSDLRKDALAFKVQRAASDQLALGDTLCRGDKVLLSGFAEYFNGEYSLFPKNDANPEIKKCTRGTGNVTVTKSGSDIEYSFESGELQNPYDNMTKLVMTATTNKGANYGVFAKVNGATINKNAQGKFDIYVKGDTNIVLTTEWTGPRDNVPAGTYTVSITPSNTGLSTMDAKMEITTYYTLKADTESNHYKRAYAVYGEGVRNNDRFENEVYVNGAILFGTEVGKITEVKVDYYASEGGRVYNGDSQASGNKVNGEATQDQSIGGNLGVVYKYTLGSDQTQFTLAAGTSYFNFYKVKFTVVVS